ncbi:MAG: class I SAM-dependent methyltransferase, partial [Candidatus Aminicenantes bacterium]|nr:class I SAM-dependent methyltransferase [Candidatus Aminicenantes bacterium]
MHGCKKKFLSCMTVIASFVFISSGCKEAGEPINAAAKASAKGSTLVTNCDFIEPSPEESARHYRGSYVFSEDWFTPNIPAWRGALGHLRGKPNIHYLEIGIFEGRSAIWMLENILTDPTSRMTGIDVFPGDLEERWLVNVERSGKAGQVTTIKGYSQKVLRTLPLNTFDVIYIDGSHTGYDVLADVLLSWDLLKDGGVIIFDDYHWRRGGGLPPELKPGPAIDAFVTMYRDFLVVIHRCYQLMACKQHNLCAGTEFCSWIGSYAYLWKEGVLKSPKGLRSLNDRERAYIKALLRSRRTGRTDMAAPAKFVDEEGFIEFIRRLGLESVLPVDPEISRLRELYGPARYSQGDEELFVRDYFKDAWDGVFVDIGGEPHRENSKTLFLERHLGWSGVIIEDNKDIRASGFRFRERLEREGIDRMDFLSVDKVQAEAWISEGVDILSLKPELVCIGISEPARTRIQKIFSDHDYVLIETYSNLDPHHLYFQP